MSITHRRKVNKQGKSERMLFIAPGTAERKAFQVILRSFFKNIIRHLGKDLELQIITPQDHREIIKQLRKVFYDTG